MGVCSSTNKNEKIKNDKLYEIDNNKPNKNFNNKIESVVNINVVLFSVDINYDKIIYHNDISDYENDNIELKYNEKIITTLHFTKIKEMSFLSNCTLKNIKDNFLNLHVDNNIISDFYILKHSNFEDFSSESFIKDYILEDIDNTSLNNKISININKTLKKSNDFKSVIIQHNWGFINGNEINSNSNDSNEMMVGIIWKYENFNLFIITFNKLVGLNLMKISNTIKNDSNIIFSSSSSYINSKRSVIFITGGDLINENKQLVSNDLYKVDLKSRILEKCNSLIFSRYLHSSILIFERYLFLIGGNNRFVECVDTYQICSSSSRKNIIHSQMNYYRIKPKLAFINCITNCYIFCFSGIDFFQRKNVYIIERIDIKSKGINIESCFDALEFDDLFKNKSINLKSTLAFWEKIDIIYSPEKAGLNWNINNYFITKFTENELLFFTTEDYLDEDFKKETNKIISKHFQNFSIKNNSFNVSKSSNTIAFGFNIHRGFIYVNSYVTTDCLNFFDNKKNNQITVNNNINYYIFDDEQLFHSTLFNEEYLDENSDESEIIKNTKIIEFNSKKSSLILMN